MREQHHNPETRQNKHLNKIVARQAQYRFENMSRETTPYDRQFIQIPYKLLDNPLYRKGFLGKPRAATYYWIRRFVVRARRTHYTDPIGIYDRYWLRGELASCLSIKRIAEDLNRPLSTIRSHIKRLEEEGIIKVDRYEAGEAADGKKHEVYVLGTCLEGEENWFIDQVF